MESFSPLNANYYELVTEIFAKVGFHQTLGMKLDQLEPGRAVVTMPVSEKISQHMGTAHAGALIGLADSAIGSAAATLLAEDESIVSSNFSVALMRPGVGGSLKAVGEVLKRGKRLIFCEAKVYGDTNELIAHVGVTLTVIPAG